ncbi:hypothetical protein CANINC_002722 [Pichia inconspicua]|uniref:CDP-diacylglycerol--glycerol-3-phosphate 3-phosphatidyltransferase n=1 Tax=Pichia inconspicua TaxID=52247 RepID=A0A4T0X0H0_9ASCO|nr:hypothetical protein CANINC_002722 [[Candida] inconspicua]
MFRSIYSISRNIFPGKPWTINGIKRLELASVNVRYINTSQKPNDKIDPTNRNKTITHRAQKLFKETQINSAKVINDGKTRLRDNKKQMSELSKNIKEKTLQRSKDIKENIKKIIPEDIHENIYTLPNFLTLTRLITSPIIGYFIIHGQVALALALFSYSCITDFLDGFIARRWNLKSVVGSIIDPLADKMLMMICTVSLATTSEIPFYLASLIIGRDVALGLSAVVIRYISLPSPKTFWRYWDFSIPSAEVHPTKISKINTALQMLYLGSMMVKPVFLLYLSDHFGTEPTTLFLNYIQYLEWTVAVTTLWSGLSYLFSRNAVKFIKR